MPIQKWKFLYFELSALTRGLSTFCIFHCFSIAPGTTTPPLFYGISLIGIIGFVAAAMMGIWLLIAIIKKGRL